MSNQCFSAACLYLTDASKRFKGNNMVPVINVDFLHIPYGLPSDEETFVAAHHHQGWHVPNHWLSVPDEQKGHSFYNAHLRLYYPDISGTGV